MHSCLDGFILRINEPLWQAASISMTAVAINTESYWIKYTIFTDERIPVHKRK